VYSLSTASSDRGRGLCANDLLHWSLMELAGARGLVRYRMGDNYRRPVSGSGFKEKFGGRPVPVFRYLRHYSQLARYSRRAFVSFRRLGRRFTVWSTTPPPPGALVRDVDGGSVRGGGRSAGGTR
jgi:hypothetical protein